MSKAVHDMFADIAPKYDWANDVLSFGIHRLWRGKALRMAQLSADATVIDVCCGTGDVAFAAAKMLSDNGRVIGVDFVYPMLALAQTKQDSKSQTAIEQSFTTGEAPATASPNAQSARTQNSSDSTATVYFVHGDALHLPLPDDLADATTVSFGIRNVDDPIAGLREMRRVLKPGGRAVIIEFGQPKIPVFAFAYRQYSKYLMPLLGGLLTGNRAAYHYLPETAERFPAAERFTELMQTAGFKNQRYTPLLGGLAYIYLAEK